jgi:hypothetical protein
MNLIEEFVKGTHNMASPEIFRRWCALAMVASVMSRRVWTCIEDDLKLFPNLYVFLVAKPGIGKSRAMEVVGELLRKMESVVFAPDEITPERMVQHLGETFMEKWDEGKFSYFALISELATFMPKPDAAWMQALARIWDCPSFYERQTKHQGFDTLINPYCSILAGVQPSWFAEGFPHNAYELGLPSRVFFIYAGDKPYREFFKRRVQAKNMDPLFRALQRIEGVEGEVTWDPPAQEAWVEWSEKGMPPAPDDPLLEGYSTRRDMHAGKLALVVAVASHPGRKVITLEDLGVAWKYLFEAEQGMPTALSGAGGNIYKMREEAVLGFVGKEYARTGKHVPEREVRRRLGRMVSSTLITPIINELINQQRLKALSTTSSPHRLLKLGKED